MAVRVLSPLLGYLGKATAARANTPEAEDTRPQLPGRLNLCMTPPFPYFSIINAPVAGGTPPFVNSVMYAEFSTFAAGASPVLFQLGPGVWEIMVNHWSEEQGAVSDATSTQILTMFDASGPGLSAILSKITNKQGVPQFFNYNFKITVIAESLWSFNRINVAGLGTGLNVGHLVILAQRIY